MLSDRRSFLKGLGAIIVAPAIVKVSSIMPVKSWDNTEELIDLLAKRIADAQEAMIRAMTENLYGDSSSVKHEYDDAMMASCRQSAQFMLKECKVGFQI